LIVGGAGRFEFAVARRENLGVAAFEFVFGRHKSDGAVQSDLVVARHELAHDTSSDRGVCGRMDSVLRDLCHRSILRFV
jgi:hypothetical protein